MPAVAAARLYPAAELRALRLRSEGLNRLHGLGG
jgi:hypothetical protein